MVTKILLVDDHAILMDGLKMLLMEKPEWVVCAATHSGNFALSFLSKDYVDLMIADYSMPDMDGLELVKLAKQKAPHLKILILSMHEDIATVREVVAAGADGYILKKYARQELFVAIDAVMNNRPYWSAEVSRALFKNLQPAQLHVLTDREMEVLKLIAGELTSRQIADQLYISERTVETHRKNLLRKTKCAGTVGLIKYAVAHKLI